MISDIELENAISKVRTSQEYDKIVDSFFDEIDEDYSCYTFSELIENDDFLEKYEDYVCFLEKAETKWHVFEAGNLPDISIELCYDHKSLDGLSVADYEELLIDYVVEEFFELPFENIDIEFNRNSIDESISVFDADEPHTQTQYTEDAIQRSLSNAFTVAWANM